MSTVQIRYNTEAKYGDRLKWRVVIDGEESLAEDVIVQGMCRTSSDILPDGRLKHHITVHDAEVIWDGDSVYIRTERPKFSIKTIPRGVTFQIGNQGFILANTEIDPDDPESELTQEHFVRMLRIALGRLNG